MSAEPRPIEGWTTTGLARAPRGTHVHSETSLSTADDGLSTPSSGQIFDLPGIQEADGLLIVDAFVREASEATQATAFMAGSSRSHDGGRPTRPARVSARRAGERRLVLEFAFVDDKRAPAHRGISGQRPLVPRPVAAILARQ